ncbi:MAG: hypothetical protein KDA61_05110, partial [Planctomycetales bacterium]|nr:hypothetical protein [Planctomycetales bacterium]
MSSLRNILRRKARQERRRAEFFLRQQLPPNRRSLSFQQLEDRRVLAAAIGDYSRDGLVDSADRIVWEAELARDRSPVLSPADSDVDGDVDGHD